MPTSPHPFNSFRLVIVWLVLGSLLGPAPQVSVAAPVSSRALGVAKVAAGAPAVNPVAEIAPPTLTIPEVPTVTAVTTTLPPICRNTNTPILDNSTAFSSLNVSTPGQVASLDFILTGTHSYVGDLVFTLTHQATGIQATIIDRPGRLTSGNGCDRNDFALTLDDDGPNGLVEDQCSTSSPALYGRPRPYEPLALFTGVSLSSTWSLTVRDNRTNDTGVVQTWCLVPTIITPALTVSASVLSQTQLVGIIQTRTLTLSNGSNTAFNAQIGEGRPVTPYIYLLHNNGPVINSPGTGPSGTNESLVQDALGLGELGFDNRQDNDNSVADDFVVTAPGGWRVSSLLFGEYEQDTGVTSTISGLFYRFWDKAPNLGGNSLYGDMDTNRLSASAFANIYRRLDTQPGNTDRPVMAVLANGSSTFTLPSGLHWLEWSANGASNPGPFVPPITINGLATTGNGLTRNGNTWSGAIDTGPAPDAPQGFPFWLYGYPVAPGCTDPVDMPWLTLSGQTSATVPSNSNLTLNVGFNTNGLTQTLYTGTLCILSTDPARQFVAVPVTLTVLQPKLSAGPALFAVEQRASTQSTRTLQIANTGVATLTWKLVEAYGMSASETAVSDSSFTYITDRANAEGRVPPAGALPPFAPTAPLAASLWLHEDFTSVASLPSKGWVTINRSNPVGPLGWAQGNATTFPSHSGASNSYAAASFDSTTGNNTISNWLLSPELVLRNGSVLTFYTRVPSPVSYADRLEVRLSMSGALTDVGATATSVGVFTHTLVTINPSLTISGYPTSWAAYTIVLTNVTPLTTTGRIGFRYFVTNGGPGGTNSNYIGIDTVRYTPVSDCTDPVDMPWLLLSATTGSATNGSPSNVTLTFNTTGLFGGETYVGNLCLITNDPDNLLAKIPVTLKVLSPYTYLPFIRK